MIDEFPADPFLKTSGSRRELNVSTAFSARNGKKPHQHWTFSTTRLALIFAFPRKALTRFDELQFDDSRAKPESRLIGPRSK
jgi:hypothetical protein